MPAKPARIDAKPAKRSNDVPFTRLPSKPESPCLMIGARSMLRSTMRTGRAVGSTPDVRAGEVPLQAVDDVGLLAVAVEQARIGRAEGGVPIGAAILIDGEVVAAGR